MAFWKFNGTVAEHYPNLGLTAQPGYVYDLGSQLPPTEDSPNASGRSVTTLWASNAGPATDYKVSQASDLVGFSAGASSNAWEFRPETYGAKGDGQLAHDAATNGTNTFSSVKVAATGAVGQWVMINGGRGTSDTAAIGTITAISGNNVTIDTTVRGLPVVGSASGLDVLWGTDDTAAINAAGAAAKTYAEAHNYSADVVFSDKIYVVSSLTQSNDGNIMYNAQIPIPRPTSNNDRKLVIGFKGVTRVSHHDYWNSTTTDLAGTVIASTQFGPNTLDGTYGTQSVFGAGTPQNAGNMAGSMTPIFVNHKPVFQNIQVVLPVYTNVTAFDFSLSTGVYVDGCSAYAFAQAVFGNGVVLMSQFRSGVFGGKLGCGMILPIAGNNADTVVPDFNVTGLATGLNTPSEQTQIGTLKIFFSGLAIQLAGSTSGHGLVIQRLSAEAYQGGLRNAQTNQPGKAPVFIGLWETETSGLAQVAGGYDINDPASTLTGEIHWANTTDAANTPVVTGGGNCRIVCESIYRGSQTPPSVPATTVALQNPFWRDATVRVTGGTVTVISVDGQTVATATGSTVTVPTGKSITLTYSVAPTWTWNLV